MDNDETHYPNASTEAIRAYYDVRDWEACPMSGPGPKPTSPGHGECPLAGATRGGVSRGAEPKPRSLPGRAMPMNPSYEQAPGLGSWRTKPLEYPAPAPCRPVNERYQLPGRLQPSGNWLAFFRLLSPGVRGVRGPYIYTFYGFPARREGHGRPQAARHALQSSARGLGRRRTRFSPH
jgi:hypothetical protein